MHGISNRDTYCLYTPHNSSVHLMTATEMQCSGWITRWNAEWLENTKRLHTFISETGTHPHGMALLIIAWVLLNCLCTSVRRFCSCLHKWCLAHSTACECGTQEQTVDHVILCYPIHRAPYGVHCLMVLDDKAIKLLLTPAPRPSAV